MPDAGVDQSDDGPAWVVSPSGLCRTVRASSRVPYGTWCVSGTALELISVFKRTSYYYCGCRTYIAQKKLRDFTIKSNECTARGSTASNLSHWPSPVPYDAGLDGATDHLYSRGSKKRKTPVERTTCVII
ncbi:hypothetical protein ALC60_04703 [Trachymyrmex zeteki]|uniref:Uncharacterized protein n=1 Tax=Mycetomoellerius zeteki TaxID=64791 RepID=A0A151X7E5_9HYME|nr:hypothetical protein ALC60_04703 [Trachymyrmex zeteki]